MYHVKADLDGYSKPAYISQDGDDWTILYNDQPNHSHPPKPMSLEDAAWLQRRVEKYVEADYDGIITRVYLVETKMTQEVIYDKFQPISDLGNIVWPDDVPFNVEVIATDGLTHGLVVEDFNNIDDYAAYVAVKIIKPQIPQHILERAREIACEVHSGRIQKQKYLDGKSDGSKIVRAAVIALMENSKVDCQPSASNKGEYGLTTGQLLTLGANKKRNRKFLKQAGEWASDTEGKIIGDCRVERVFGNKILAVRVANKYGGRVVITPSGHTVAYTTAKKVYQRVNAFGSFNKHSVNCHEAIGSSRRFQGFRVQADDQTITVGCQTIPFQALADLAEREGWYGRPYGYHG